MPYGTIKVDTVTFTDGGVDKSVTVSGLVQNPTFSGNVTATGTISGATVRATTVSGTTVTGTTANFASGVFTTQISGAIIKAPDGSAAVPSLQVGTGATVSPGLYGAGTDLLGFSTGGAGRLFIDSTGRVGIGTSSPNRKLEISDATVDNFVRVNTTGATKSGIEFASGGTVYAQIYFNNTSPYDFSLLQQYTTGSLILGTNNTERLRIDSSGRLLVGTSTATNQSGVVGLLQVEATSGNEAAIKVKNNQNTSTAAYIALSKSRGTTVNSNTIVQDGDNIGSIIWFAADGTDTASYCAEIIATIDGIPGVNDVPGRLVFSTTADGNATASERMRIDSSGRVGIGTTSPIGKLDITGTNTPLIVQSTVAATNYITHRHTTSGDIAYLGGGGGGALTAGTASDYVIRANLGSLIFACNGDNERARIDSSGRVGIGTSSPGGNLDVRGISGTTIIRAVGSDSNGNADVEIFTPGTTGSSRLYFADTAAQSGSIIYSHSNDSLAFGTNNTERVRIDSSGRVGIGTSSPASKLEIYNVGTYGTAYQPSVFITNSSSGGTATANTGLGAIAWATDSNSTVTASIEAIRENPSVGANSAIAFRTGSSGGGTERLRIDSSGNVGIGTTSPSSLGSNVTTVEIQGPTTTRTGGIRLSSSDSSQKGAFYVYDGAAVLGTETAHPLGLYVSNTERLRIDSSGNVGIGTGSPLTKLEVRSGVITAGSNSAPSGTEILRGYYGNDGALTVIGSEYSSGGPVIGCGVKPSTSAAGAFLSSTSITIDRGAYTIQGSIHKWYKGASQTVTENSSVSTSEVMRIDSSGRLLVGTSAARTFDLVTAALEVEGTSYNGSSISITNNENNGNGAFLNFGKSRGTSVGSNTIVNSGDNIAHILFHGANGSGTNLAAAIDVQVDGTPGVNDMPGRLVFSTTADGASSPTERLRIDSSGRLLAGTSSSASAGGVTAQHAFSHSTSSQWAAQVQHTTAAGNAPFGLAIRYTAATPNGTSSDFLFCEDATAVRARIYSNGGLGNYSANNVNLSDRNAKKDIAPAAGTWDCLKEWEIVHFRYKDQPEDTDLSMGVIAQQVAESCPEVITVFQEAKEATETDPAQEERIGVKEQQMMWMAIKALQEAQLRIETLEAKVAALEGA